MPAPASRPNANTLTPMAARTARTVSNSDLRKPAKLYAFALTGLIRRTIPHSVVTKPEPPARRDPVTIAHEVNAWQDHRNKHHAKANWQFKTADARVKLKRLYPQFG
jgi:hypothetical protein